MEKFKNKGLVADILILLMAFIWGSGFIVTKNSLETLDSNQLIFLRFVIASITLFVINIRKLNLITKTTLKKGFIIGFALCMGFMFQTYGLVETPAGKSGFLTATYVAFVPFLAMLWGKEKNKPDIYNVIATVMMLIGIFFLTMGNEIGLNINKFDGITLIGSVFWALHVFLVGELSENEDPIILCMMQMVFAGLFTFIFISINGSLYSLGSTHIPIAQMLYLGVISSALAFLLQNVAQKYTSPTHAGILMSMESVFSTILGILILKEVFTFKMLIGAGIIFIALIMSETKFDFLKKEKA